MRALLLSAIAAALLAGCAATPPAEPVPVPDDPPPPQQVVLPPAPTAYELNQRERALALARQGRLADAALIWETLATIRPRVAEYREQRAELERRITAGVAERVQRAEQAAARGQFDAATQQYLAALALQPDNERVADALRGVERERNKRSYLGKLSRNTLTRQAMADAEMVPPPEDAPTAAPASAEASNDNEHAALLASQGEFDEAIRLLEQRTRANRRDDAARVLLADVYVQKAEAIAPRQRAQAIALLERAVRTDPRHPRAAERLKALRPAAAAAARPAP